MPEDIDLGGLEDGHASRDSFSMQLPLRTVPGRANQDVDLSSSLPSLAALQFQDANEIWQRARAKVKVLCYRNSQIKTDTQSARAILVFDAVTPYNDGVGVGFQRFSEYAS